MEEIQTTIEIENYRFNIHEIPEEILELPNKISSRRRAAILKYHGNVSKYIFSLYFLWFIEKLQKREIAELLKNSIVNIHNNLYDFRWNYSQDYLENNILAEQEHEKLNILHNEAKIKYHDIDFSSNQIFHMAMKTKLRPDAYIKHGYSTKEEYVKVLCYLIFEFKLSPQPISIIFNETIGNTHSRLESLGLNQTHAQGMETKKFNKSQNYTKSINRGNISRLNNQLKKLTLGSINEDFVRNQISLRLFEFVDPERFDVVVGINNTGNLGSLEIDIPLIIWDTNLQKIHRFAIEYNADFYHKKKNDEEKQEIAEKRGWIYLPIVETSSANFSNDKNRLIKVSIDLCKKVQSLVY